MWAHPSSLFSRFLAGQRWRDWRETASSSSSSSGKERERRANKQTHSRLLLLQDLVGRSLSSLSLLIVFAKESPRRCGGGEGEGVQTHRSRSTTTRSVCLFSFPLSSLASDSDSPLRSSSRGGKLFFSAKHQSIYSRVKQIIPLQYSPKALI